MGKGKYMYAINAWTKSFTGSFSISSICFEECKPATVKNVTFVALTGEKHLMKTEVKL